MMPAEVGTCDWLAEELAQARFLERSQAMQLANALREEEPYADAIALANHLVRLKVLSPYQAKRAVEGDARKLVLGLYNVVEPLEPGSMGTNFRALGRADRRPYVVKVLPQRNQWNVRIVRRQVQAFETMQPHDAVVPFIDVGTAGGQHYLVWPFVEGKTLDALVQERGPFAAGEIAFLGVQIASGLRHCHERGIVHGVLKPTNVMIGYDGETRLLDFGIGALLAENHEDDSMVDTSSAAHILASMLECASPELVIDPANLTPAGDQYSLGCVLYFCATGRYPFPGGTAIEKVVAHQKQRPMPIQSLNREMPTLLVDVIERLMAKAPQDRFRKLDEAICDLKALAGSTARLVPPATPVDIATPPPRSLRAQTAKKSAPATPAVPSPPETTEAQPLPKPEPRRGWLGRLFGG